MKPIKFFKSEKDHLYEKTEMYINFRDFFTYYNRWPNQLTEVQ